MQKNNPLPQLPAASTTSDAVPTDLTIIAPGTLTVMAPEFDDAEMSSQFEAQYPKAVGGMREVLIFGVLMALLEYTLSTRGQGSGNGVKGDGVKGWLAKWRPEINRQTAYRFKLVAESVQAVFCPSRNLDRVEFYALATSAPEALPAKLQARQQELFEFVNGTSQKAWMDRFEPKPRAGALEGKYHPRKPGGGLSLTDESLILWQPLMRDLELQGITQKSWAHLPDSTLRDLRNLLIEVTQLLPKKQ